ncbi:hypothetical protein RHSIM_RhsimUnG0211300 [Rhododendron simsii]|uniref:Glutathione S-transferase n=1 Tax=Rhododendron simsii TaxID=118357 RepID=A0A834FVN9_RHOSS|nr:hypothetical protein RHSIM_RhsimUnG0211300 [Rhododendron simsii]
MIEQWWPSIACMENIFTMGEEAKAAAALEKVIERAMPLEDAFAKCSKGKDFFSAVTALGNLDTAFGSFLEWLRAIEMMTGVKLLDETKNPGLFGWAEEFGFNAAVKVVIPKWSDTIGYLDTAFGSFLEWLRAIEMMTGVKLLDETKNPGLFGWAEKFGFNAAVKVVIPKWR